MDYVRVPLSNRVSHTLTGRFQTPAGRNESQW